jgi:cyclopropane-fatty-acyl-phospholipid synthase
MTRCSSLIVENVENIGNHYALTLNRWRQSFHANQDKIIQLGFEPDFIRKWDYYLALCEAAFQKRALGDLQLVLTRQNNSALANKLS